MTEAIALAKERNRVAAERTLMAWIRTSLALIGFGFGIDRVVVSLGQVELLSRVFALSFIGLGIAATIMAAVEHRKMMASLQTPVFQFKPSTSLAAVTGAGLVLIGAGVFAGVLLDL